MNVKDTITIPEITIGSIIGKGGSNIKRISQESGARCFVRAKENLVEITGNRSSIETAKRLIKQTINNCISVYAHPEIAVIALDVDIDKNKEYEVEFTPFTKDGRSSNHANKELFIIKLASAEIDDIDGITSSFEKGLSISQSNNIVKESFLCLYNEHREELLNKFVEVVQKAKETETGARVKITASIGTTTFYNSRAGSVSNGLKVPLDKFLKYKVGVDGDIKVTFNNSVEESTNIKTEKFLEDSPRWSKKGDSERVVLHVIDPISQSRFSLTLKPNGERLEILKYKTSKTKKMFLNVLKIDTNARKGDKYHVRLLVSTSKIAKASTCVEQFVSSLKFDAKRKKVTIPEGSQYKSDSERFKAKRSFKNGDVRLDLAAIHEGFAGSSQSEIELVNSELNNLVSNGDVKFDDLKAKVVDLLDISLNVIRQ